jgi:malonyl-CoA O-methyltransferase
VVAALNSANFNEIDVLAELEVAMYPDVSSLVRSVNGIGAGNAARNAPAGLAGRSTMLRMMELYRERYGTADGVPATYQVLYGSGTKTC